MSLTSLLSTFAQRVGAEFNRQPFKKSVKAATTANITLSGTTGLVDGSNLDVGDRVLVKNQTDGRFNGIWVVQNGSWTRAIDFDETEEYSRGVLVYVGTGVVNAGTIWSLANWGAGPQDSYVFKQIASTSTDFATTDSVAAAILAASHPVGSIYFTTTNVNPSTHLGGTWAAWGSGRVPIGVDTAQTEFSTVEKTGGAKTHTHPLGDAGQAQITQGSSGVIASRRIATTTYTETFRQTGAGTAGTAGAQTNAVPLQGSTDAGSTLPPYVTCYMWKRTA